jgi:hypothetical protein
MKKVSRRQKEKMKRGTMNERRGTDSREAEG